MNHIFIIYSLLMATMYYPVSFLRNSFCIEHESVSLHQTWGHLENMPRIATVASYTSGFSILGTIYSGFWSAM